MLLPERVVRAGASFQSLTEAVDTSTSAGRMLMQMLGTFGEFERSMLRERTLAGLKSGAAVGRAATAAGLGLGASNLTYAEATWTQQLAERGGFVLCMKSCT